MPRPAPIEAGYSEGDASEPRRAFVQTLARSQATIRGVRIATRLAGIGSSYADVIRSRRYFPLWLGQLASSFGDTLHYIALVVLVFELSGQGIAVAGLVVSETVPTLVFGPIAGVIIDRFSRKAVLIGADLVRGALALSLVWPQGVWHAYVVAAGLSAAGVFFNPTVNAVIPALTTERQRLAANSVAWSTAQLVQIVGASVAGGIIALVGTRAAFAVNAASFLVSASLIALLAIPPAAREPIVAVGGAFQRFTADLRAGLSYARRDRFVARLLLIQSLASFAVGATGAMLVVLAERHLRLPPEGFAYLIAAIGAGALLGPLIPNLFARDYRSARWLFVPYVIRGVGDVLIAVFTQFQAAVLILFVYGLNTSTGMVVFNSTIQGAIPDRMRGRVFTLLDMDWSIFTLLSLAAGGVLADRLGIEPVFWAGGTLLLIAGLFGLLAFRRTDFAGTAADAD